jgi:hypothetical protein
MLRQCTVTRYEYDAGADTVRLHTDGGAGPSGPRTASLLLGRTGSLIGVDLRQASDGMGDVVMWGPHEDVARTERANVHLEVAKGGELCRVDIPKATKAISAPERTPYGP